MLNEEINFNDRDKENNDPGGLEHSIDHFTRYALTTFDNPYDPFTEFDDWFMWDIEHGYNTCSKLARFTVTALSMTEEEENSNVSDAIDEIIKYDPFKIYKKVEQKYKISV